MLTKKEQALLDALETQAAAQGIEIVTLEIVGAKKSPTIRVYIDTENGVSFDELSSAQAWINDIMDEIDPFVVKTTSPIDGRSNFTGVLKGTEGDDVVMSCDEVIFKIPYQAIKRAHVKGTVDFK